MMHEERSRHRLRELCGRIRLDAHAALFKHHVALGSDDGFLQQEVRHAVGLELHHRLEILARDALEIGRVVERGEGVLLTAEARDHLRELARRVLLRALEHQMLEKMRDARLPERIVCRTVAIPDHVSDDGNAAIGDDDDVKTVVEGEGRQARTAALRSPEGGGVGAK